MNRDLWGEQIDRLRLLRNFPIAAAGRKELIRTFKRNFPDIDSARVCIDRIVTELDDSPTPSTIRRYALSMGMKRPAAEKLDDLRSRQDCQDCYNTGWKQVVHGDRSGVEHCRCPLGQAIAGKKAAVEADQKGLQTTLV